MTEKEIVEAKELLSIKQGGRLRGLFYVKSGLPRYSIYTKQKILNELGIMDYEPNTLECDGLSRLLGVSLAQLRKQAKDAGLAWVDIEYSKPGGSKIAHHGFSKDIDTIMANVEKFEGYARQRREIAKTTLRIAENHRVLISA